MATADPRRPGPASSDPDLATHDRRALIAGLGALGGLAAASALAGRAMAGPLNPPAGPVASTPGPEPRIPINAANTPGTASAVYRISQPGAYYLTGNLAGVAAKAGIEIATDNVDIDLKGYTLQGVAGSLTGIRVGGDRNNIFIHDGYVLGFGGGGISLTTINQLINHRIERVTCSNNTGTGIYVWYNAIIRECIVCNNTGNGIIVQGNGLIESCVAASNSGTGIEGGTNSVISRCVVTTNGGAGISSIFGGCLVVDCVAASNGAAGISVNTGCLVRGNMANSNNGTTDSAGIRVTGNNCLIEENNCTNNNHGIYVTSTFNIILCNTCHNNAASNYVFVANNRYGPIIDITAAGAAAVNGSAAAGTLVSTDPWANFSY